MKDDKLDEVFKMISEALKKLNKLKKLKYPKLSNEMNELLWCFDGINECNERMVKENDDASIKYYTQEINNRYKKIRKNWLYYLN